MDFLVNIFDVFFNQIMVQPALMLGIVTLVGYLALRRPWFRAIAGALKTAVGVMILQVGAGQLVGKFRPILFAVSEKFGIEGTIIDPYAAFPAVSQALGEGLSWVGYTVMIGFGINLLLVALKRWTKIRTVFLTGHVMYLQAALITWMVYYYFGTGMGVTVLVAGILCALYWAIMSNILLDATNKITNNAGFSIGHQQMLMNWIATKVSHKIGDPEESVEKINMPGWLSIFQDNVVASSVIMLFFFGALMLALGSELVQGMAGGQNWLVFIFMTGLSFAVNVTIILTGVRMFVAELSTSFKGVSDRLLPGAAIAVDCAALYAFAPNVIIFGFIMGAVGQIIGLVGLFAVGSSILIIPGFVPLFFDNATIAIYANKFGGWKAAAVLCVVTGIVQIFGGAWAVTLSGLQGGWQGNFDFATIWPAVMTVMKWIAAALGLG